MVAILLACLISAPTDCREVELYLVERMPIPAALEGQARAVTWLEEHPGMVMRKLKVVAGRGA